MTVRKSEEQALPRTLQCSRDNTRFPRGTHAWRSLQAADKGETEKRSRKTCDYRAKFMQSPQWCMCVCQPLPTFTSLHVSRFGHRQSLLFSRHWRWLNHLWSQNCRQSDVIWVLMFYWVNVMHWGSLGPRSCICLRLFHKFTVKQVCPAVTAKCHYPQMTQAEQGLLHALVSQIHFSNAINGSQSNVTSVQWLCHTGGVWCLWSDVWCLWGGFNRGSARM